METRIQHNVQQNIEVNDYLKAEGWAVLRFWGEEIQQKTLYCLEAIRKAVDSA